MNQATEPDKKLQFEDVLKNENDHLKSLRLDNSEGLVGLAFSGGGIRSATVNLGILQALADKNLLRRFDYLSTVSGGTFIGAFFTALLKRHGGLNKVQDNILKQEAKFSANMSDGPIGFLRTYSNYLTPKMGLFSLDTLASFSVWVTNTLLNQLVLFAGFVAIFATIIGINKATQNITNVGCLYLGVIVFGLATLAGLRESSKRLMRSRWKLIFFFGFIGVIFFVLSGVALQNTPPNWVNDYLKVVFSPQNRLGLGVPLLLLFISLAMILLLGMLGRKVSIPYTKLEQSISTGFREWWSRFGGVSLLVVMLWLLLFTVAIYLPQFIHKKSDTWISLSAFISYISAWGVAKLGQSTHTGGTNPKPSLEKLTKFLPYIVIALTLICIGYFTYWMAVIQCINEWYICLAAVGIVLIGGWRFDINIFSLHNFYRNRLTRCYLGATVKGDRKPNPFTGFTFSDDIQFSECAQRPLHIINTALNITAGKELAWQQRMAASFAFTPIYSGFELPDGQGAYRHSSEYNDKHLMLGSLIAVSGAAASPNGGYHTNPAMAFIMTMFNARLGRWFGNPITEDKWKNQSPGFSIRYLIWELFAKTREDSDYVYLSDGGHFENLGVYELLRRRCRLIVAIDAGQDKNFTFEDLGNMIRKSRTDLGVQIDIDISEVDLAPEKGFSKEHFTMGRIDYSDGTQGLLIYIKNSLTGNESLDLKNHKRQSPDFPHHSTGDQFFDETQFESYRQLGYQMMQEVIDKAPSKFKLLLKENSVKWKVLKDSTIQNFISSRNKTINEKE